MYRIKWSYGVDEADVELDLYKEGEYSGTIATGLQSSDGSYHWTVPYSVEPGSNYTISILATSTGARAESGGFTIKEFNAGAGESKFDMSDMMIVIAVSSIAMGAYAGYLYKIDRHRWPDEKPRISREQFMIVCTAFADFTSDVAWAIKIIVEDEGGMAAIGWVAVLFMVLMAM